MAKHVLTDAVAGVYAATTVAAKAVVWIAVGLGFWVLPEATRRAAGGGDPRPVLGRGLAVIAGLSACALTIFAVVPELLLRTAFGARVRVGSGRAARRSASPTPCSRSATCASSSSSACTTASSCWCSP